MSLRGGRLVFGLVGQREVGGELVEGLVDDGVDVGEDERGPLRRGVAGQIERRRGRVGLARGGRVGVASPARQARGSLGFGLAAGARESGHAVEVGVERAGMVSPVPVVGGDLADDQGQE